MGGPPIGLGRVGWPSRRSRSGQEALLEGREVSGGPPKGTGGVGRPSHRSGKGRVAYSKVWEWSESPPGGPGGVGRPSRRAGRSREALSVGQKGWGGTRGYRRSFRQDGKSFWKSGKGRESFPKCWEWFGGPPQGWAVFGGPPGESGGVRRPILIAGGVGSPPKSVRRSQQSLTGVCRGYDALLEGREGSGVPPGGPRGVGCHF